MPKEAEDRGDDLAPDASLATDLGDEDARRKEQLEYYGGDPIEDDFDEDDDNVDRGDSLEPESKDEEEEEEDESEDSDDASEDEDDSADDDGESDDDDEADSESDLDSDDEGDEDDGDEDSDDGGEVDDDDEQSDDTSKTDRRVPLDRFNEVNERRKAAEQELADLKAQGQAKEEADEGKYDFDAAEDEYMELLLDGKTKEAGAKRREIREAERAEFKKEAVAESSESASQQAMLDAVDSLANQAEVLYPVLDQSHEDFNPAIVRKVTTFMRGYEADGMNPDDALVAGLADAIELFDLDTKYGDTEDDEPDPKPEKKVTKKKAIKKTKDKLRAQKQQGKSPAGEGKGSSDAGAVVPDIEQMTDEEIDALPPETLARLRGDFVD